VARWPAASLTPSAKGGICWEEYVFFAGIRPLTPIHLAGRGGRRDDKKLDSRVLLVLRQFPPLAGRGGTDRVCLV
jgi:hypothetical protein